MALAALGDEYGKCKRCPREGHLTFGFCLMCRAELKQPCPAPSGLIILTSNEVAHESE